MRYAGCAPDCAPDAVNDAVNDAGSVRGWCGGPWARARIEAAVNDTLDAGFRTGDIMVGRAPVMQHNTHTHGISPPIAVECLMTIKICVFDD